MSKKNYGFIKLKDNNGNKISNLNPLYTVDAKGIPATYTKQTANGDTWLVQKGQLNKLRLRPQIMNEHAESSRNIQGVVSSANIVGQIFKASHDNINGINLTLESAAGVLFDDFESYANDEALQAVWLATGIEADVEVATVYQGSQAMYLNCSTTDQIGKVWKKSSGGGVDFTGYTGEFQMYSNKEYDDVKLEVFVEDGSGNTASRQIVQSNKDVWTKLVVPTASLVDDGSPTDMTDIDFIGFRVAKNKKDGYVILDILVSVPPPGEVEIKLWDMGASLPGSVSLDSGTQYTKLGDLGISGVQAASAKLQLLGGKRMYQINDFVAGVALEIPTNELLSIDNYYAISIHYVDTNVNVYGPNEVWDDYYENGYGFTAPDEATSITAIGSQKDIQFIIFSTQDVYVDEFSQFVDAAPNGHALETIYVEDENMRRTDVLISGIQALQTVLKEIDRPFFMSKGSKFEVEYSDDFSDDVSKINIVMQYYYIPITCNG